MIKRKGSNMKEKQVLVILFIMCLLLTIGICIQIKTVSKATIGAGSSSTQNELRDEVLRMDEKYKRTQEKLNEKQEELDELISNISNTDSNSLKYSKRLEELESLLGYNTLEGTGIIITIRDAEVSSNVLNISDYLVHDKDLLQIVNALVNAGAEAVDINGQRIVSTTSITCIGNVIKINDEKVGTPYVISAIGSVEKLYGAMTMPGGYLSLLQDEYNLRVNVEKSNFVKVQKYDGVYKMNFGEISN